MSDKVKTKKKAQIHMEDNVIENKELLDILESREDAKEMAKAYRKADKAAKEKIAALNIPTPYRVGRFIISKIDTKARDVAFTTEAGTRISIKVVDK